VCALDVSSIRKTDGDAGGCLYERDEIASDFEKVPSGARVDYKWRGGGRRFGIDNMANIFYVNSLFRVFCRPFGSLMTSLEARDEIGSVATLRFRGGCSGLMALSWMVARGTCVTTVCYVTVGPAVSARAFARCHRRDGRDVGG
jgi:hypothetical protein